MDDDFEGDVIVFEEALRLPEAERTNYIKVVCADNADMRHRVEVLLRAYEKAGDFLREPADGLPIETGPVTVIGQKPGDRIGRYKLLQQIGEGGCGVVYKAEQEEPVRRMVALKIIKPGMDTKSVIVRFEAERQVLALMDHPNIAKVFDAGATDSGRPYFVMELVRGIKITEYCDQNSLTTEARLNLFIQVCQAVQHAHQKGIIHRDLKPSNILVTTSLEGAAVPVVIDFGIAKATSYERLAGSTVFTGIEMLIGTPAYMSPEQAELTSVDVDTRSDIYSLGALLYELLTGSTPFDGRELLKAGHDEIRRVIREQDPVNPSIRLSKLTTVDLTTIADFRKSQPPNLIRVIRGDLDWIVMKALEKDRTRRYETANGLALDVQRFLADEAISARPPSALYRFHKTVRRHKILFLAISSITLFLVLSLIIVSTSLAKERRSHRESEASKATAEAEAVKSRQVTLFLERMLQGVGPSVALGQDTKMLHGILDRTAEAVGKEMTNQPAIEAELRSLIGRVYFEIGNYDQAEKMHRAALTINQKLFGLESHPTATSLSDLGMALDKQRKYVEAEGAHQDSLRIRRKLFGNENADVAVSLNDLAIVFRHETKLDEAEALTREALRIRSKLFGKDSLEVADTLHNLSVIQGVEGKRADSEATAREMLAMRRGILGNENPLVAAALLDVAWAAGYTGKLDEAESLQREALAMQQRLLTDEHPEVAKTLASLGDSMRQKGKLNDSQAVLSAALSIQVKLLGAEAVDSLNTMHSLAATLEAESKWSEAEIVRREALVAWRKRAGNEDRQSLYALRELTATLEAQGKWAEAETLHREELEAWRKRAGDDDPQTLYAIQLLARSLEAESKWPEAEALRREALATWRKRAGNEDLQTLYAMRDLATTLQAEGKLAEAEATWNDALALWRKRAGNQDSQTLYTLSRLGLVLEAEGKLAEAEQAHREVLAVWRKQGENENLPPWSELENLTRVLIAEQKFHDAEQLLDETLTPSMANQLANVKLLNLRVDVRARGGQWQEAATDAALAFEVQPSNEWRFPIFAALLVKTDNRAAYEQFCKKLLNTFADTTNIYVADQVAKSCLFLPSSEMDLKAISRLADLTVTQGSDGVNAMPYFQDCKALSEYRLGHYTEAVEWAQKPLKIPGLHVHGHAYAVIAMAEWQMGNKDEARAMFTKGEALAPSIMPTLIAEDPSNNWQGWLYARIQLDEAAALMQIISTNESGLNKP